MKLISSVPTSFMLGADRYPIILNPSLMSDKDMYGYLDRPNKRIYYTNIRNYKPMLIDEQIDTFYHERTHAILDLAKPSLSDDEDFVNLFSNLLRQTDNTLKFK
jgi:hypothetical protein